MIFLAAPCYSQLNPLTHAPSPTPMSESASENTGAAPVHTEQSHEAIARAERAAALATLAITREEERSERENDEKHERNSASVVASSNILDPVKLRVGGKLFEAEKSALIRFDHTFFCGLFSSGAWQPEADGAYFIDRPAMGFDRILEYLSSRKLSVEGLSDLEEDCLYSSLDYLLIPYRRQWRYNTAQVIDGLVASYVIELKDGRLCGTYENDVIVWNMDTNAIEMTLEGHGSLDTTIRVWNVFSGVCEMTMITQSYVFSLVQLADDRICSGDYDGSIYMYSVLTGECELSWKEHTNWVNAIVCIDATRVCSGSDDRTIKVWSAATGECERTLEGHTDAVDSMVLMQDGRLCSASRDSTLKLWNLATGECEKTLISISNLDTYHTVMQLSDGRLVSCFDSTVHVWS